MSQATPGGGPTGPLLPTRTGAAPPPTLVGFLVRRAHWWLLGSLVCGGLSFGATYLMKPIFTAKTTFLPPQGQQSTAASALASLGSIAGLPAGGGTGRASADQYLGFLQSVTVTDRIVDHFKLQALYDTPFKASARRALLGNVRIAAGRKDGLIVIEVDDTSPEQAAQIANRFVDELRALTATLAVTEAQQRRVFFDRQLIQTRANLTKAQIALQGSGFSGSALKTEPKATAEAFARLRAESMAADMRVQTLRMSMAPAAIELQQAEATAQTLRMQLARVEDNGATTKLSSSDYIEKFREFRYHEALFDLFARQLELARADEAREGPLIQVLDAATPPEVKSRPKRLNAGLTGTAIGFVLIGAWLAFRHRSTVVNERAVAA